MTRPRTQKLIAATALLLASALVAGACETDLQARLDDSKARRFAEAAAKLTAVETNRTQALESTLPAPDAVAEGSKHPMVLWRQQVGDRDDATPIQQLLEEYRGTPTEQAAIAGAAYAKESRAFWKGDQSLDKYYGFVKGYVADAAKDKDEAAGNPEFVSRPFVAEAAFDLFYVHAARFYQLGKMREDVQVTTAFPYWQLAFDEPSRSRESFSAYVTRLCRAGALKERCAGVPHERRPMAINKPYLEWLKGQVKAFADAHTTKVFSEVATRFDKGLDVALTQIPDLTEDPVLPQTFSDRAASSGMRLLASPSKGAWLHDKQLSEDYSGGVPGGLAAAAAAKIQELKDTPGNMVDFERVVLEVPHDVSGANVVKMINAFPRELVRQFDLIGRRRADESLRRTGVLLRRPAPDEGQSTSYTFKDAGKVVCDYAGVAGRPAIGRKEPGSYLVIKGKTVQAAKLARDPETRELSVGDLTLDTVPSNLESIQDWAAKNEGIIRLFVSTSYSYDEMLKFISAVQYGCEDVEYAVDERGDHKITIKCGKTVERDVSLVVGFCD